MAMPKLLRKVLRQTTFYISGFASETSHSADLPVFNLRRVVLGLCEISGELFSVVEFTWRRHSLRAVLDSSDFCCATKQKMDFDHLRRMCTFHMLSGIPATLESGAAGAISQHSVWRRVIGIQFRVERLPSILYRWVYRIYCVTRAGSLPPHRKCRFRFRSENVINAGRKSGSILDVPSP